jgi:hypothetical protein
MFTLNNQPSPGKDPKAIKRLEEFRKKFMAGDDWSDIDNEEKKRRIVELFELTESITNDQTAHMNKITKGRAGDDFFKSPMEWVRRVEVCKSERLKFDIIVLIPIFIKIILIAAAFYIAADLGISNPIIIPVLLLGGFVAMYAMRDLVRIAKAAWIMGYVIGTVDTGAPLVRMFTTPQGRYLADQLVQISLKAISSSELKRYMVMVNTHRIDEDKLRAMGVKSGDELYAKLMTEEPKRAVIK